MLKASAHSSLVRWMLLMVVIQALMVFLILPVFAQYFPTLYAINQFPDGYNRLAANIIAGNGYKFFPEASETLLRTPGYPVILTMVFYFFPNSLVAVQIVNLVLGLMTAWIIVRLTQRFTSNNTALTLALASFLLHPGIIFAQSRGGVESLYALCITALVFALCRAFDRQKSLDYLVAGVVLGLATTVKSTTILFPVFLFGCLLLTRKWNIVLKVWLPRLVLMGAAMFVVLLPWIVRNYLLVHQFIPTMTIAGTVAFDGLLVCKNYSLDRNPKQDLNEGGRQRAGAAVERFDLPYPSEFFQYFYKVKDEVSFNHYLLTTVFNEYRKSPGLLLQCALQNVFNFWFLGWTWYSTLLNVAIQVPFLLLSAIGMFYCVRQGYLKQIFPIVAIVAYFWVIHLPIIGFARFSIPVIPILAIFCGIAFHVFLMKSARGHTDRVRT